MKHIIQKMVTTMTIAATALEINGYGQDALVNISTRRNIEPTAAEAALVGGCSSASEKRVILRTIGESLVDQGVAIPIADARLDVSKLDLANPANNEIIGLDG